MLKRLTTLVAVSLLVLTSPFSGQEPSWTSPFQLLLTPQRAMGFARAAEQGLNYLPGEVLVKFKPGTVPERQQRALDAVRSRPTVSNLQWVGDVAILRDTQEWNSTILAEQLSEQPEVEYAEPNYIHRFNATPNDPAFKSRQWNFSLLNMPAAWDINPGANTNITVAVIDSGITTVNQTFVFPTWNGRSIQNITVPYGVNPDLSGRRLVNPRDFAFWNGPVLDMVGHATHVGSTIGEDTDNNLALAGLAYKANIMPLKACVGFWELQFIFSSAGIRGTPPPNAGGCATDDEVRALQFAADNGANVVNISLGGTSPSITYQNALQSAVSKGVFISISAGNAYEDGNRTEYPSAYAQNIDGVMAVGAIAPSLKRSFYSNTGSYVEIAAPGGSSREGGDSGKIWQSTIFEDDSDLYTVFFPRFDRYAETPLEGTSMASPHVAGIAALIMSQGVTNPAAVEALIRRTARDLGSPGRDSEFGFGLIQPRAALLGQGVTR